MCIRDSFVTDADKMECVMDNPYILIYDKKISNLKDLLPILQPAAESLSLIHISCTPT